MHITCHDLSTYNKSAHKLLSISKTLQATNSTLLPHRMHVTLHDLLTTNTVDPSLICIHKEHFQQIAHSDFYFLFLYL